MPTVLTSLPDDPFGRKSQRGSGSLELSLPVREHICGMTLVTWAERRLRCFPMPAGLHRWDSAHVPSDPSTAPWTDHPALPLVFLGRPGRGQR